MSERKEFEKVFPVPKDCEWDGLNSYCWPYTRARHPYNNLWEGWEARAELAKSEGNK